MTPIILSIPTHLPITRMQNRDQYRMSIRGVSGLALEESNCTPSLECSELFSLKSIYVKYKNAILSHIDCLFCTWKNKTNRHVLPIYLIGSILIACFTVVIKYLGKCLTICLILSCAKEATYKRQNSILIFYINTFQRK